MNAVNWFEIPAADFDRACRFYEGVLNVTLRREMFGEDPNGMFPYDEGVNGAVALVPYARPGADGPVVYLNAKTEAGINEALTRVEALGGRILMPTLAIGQAGFMALIIDSEGNRIGLHAPAVAS